MAPVNRSVSNGFVLLAVVLALTGCTSEKDRPATPSAGEPPITTTPSSGTTGPSETPSSGPDDGPLTPTATPSTLAERLLPTTSVPGLNAAYHWQDGETGPAGTDPFGLCAKADLASIGATSVVQRTYFPPVDTDDNAAEQVAEFPDATTTATAMKVLTSWQKHCTAGSTRSGALASVPGGSWYQVVRTSKNVDDRLVQSVGLVTSGQRIAVLRIDVVTRTTRDPLAKEPMIAMVQAAAALLRS